MSEGPHIPRFILWQQQGEAIKAEAAKLPFVPRQAFERALQQGFIVTFGKSFKEARQLYRRWCVYKGRPFTSVQKHINQAEISYAEIALDMSTVPRQLPEDVQSEIHALLSDTALDRPNRHVSVSPRTAKSKAVGLDRVEEVVARLYELVN